MNKSAHFEAITSRNLLTTNILYIQQSLLNFRCLLVTGCLMSYSANYASTLPTGYKCRHSQKCFISMHTKSPCPPDDIVSNENLSFHKIYLPNKLAHISLCANALMLRLFFMSSKCGCNRASNHKIFLRECCIYRRGFFTKQLDTLGAL